MFGHGISGHAFACDWAEDYKDRAGSGSATTGGRIAATAGAPAPPSPAALPQVLGKLRNG
jgi:hypothetical protein